jgi:hypothetical protein
MQTLWIGLFVLLVIGLLVALLWWRFKGGGAEKKESVPVVAANHPSIVKRHYGPAPAPPVAAPPLAADNPLSQLMPEEDFRAQEEKDIQAEADRIEAEEAEQREAAEQASQQPALPETPEEVPAAAPLLRSSLHGARATVSVFDALGLDEPAPVADELPATAAAPVADELPTAAAPDDYTVSESLFYNPFSVDAPSKNDAANRLTKAELRRRTREAIQAQAGGNKAALTTLLAESNPSR